MRLLASVFFLISSLAVTQANAEDVVPQPLTRADCEGSGLAWNDSANACNVTFEEAETTPALDVTGVGTGQPLTRRGCDLAAMQWDDSANACDVGEAETEPGSVIAGVRTGQPLTRRDCDLAAMQWNDSANVCGRKLGVETSQADATAAPPPASKILIKIDKAAQKMTVSVDGEERYHWPVSTGRAGYSTPSGTFTATSMNEIWYSKQWDNAPMPHAIFFTRDGHAIHGTNEVRHLGQPASHGCVRISPQNAATLFTLVADNGLKNTQVVLAGTAPGRGDRTTSHSRPKPKEPSAAASPRYKSQYTFAPPDDKPTTQSTKRRGGLFKNLFRRQ